MWREFYRPHDSREIGEDVRNPRLRDGQRVLLEEAEVLQVQEKTCVGVSIVQEVICFLVRANRDQGGFYAGDWISVEAWTEYRGQRDPRG